MSGFIRWLLAMYVAATLCDSSTGSVADPNAIGSEEGVVVDKYSYVPGEIIVKFRAPAAGKIGGQCLTGKEVRGLGLSDSLNRLNGKHGLTSVEPVFKGFKAKQQRMRELTKKDRSLLTKKEMRLLRRMGRARTNARTPELDRIYRLKIEPDPNTSHEQIVAEYNADADVEYAELNYVVSIDLTPNDPFYQIQWPLDNTGQMYPESGHGTADCDIDAPEAWDVGTGHSDVLVAVVDTGVDYRHRDLDDNMWVNVAEALGVAGVDDDGNGYVDDICGYDFCNGDGDPTDDHGHGTHCAGIIGAEGNNGLDIAGVCWNAQIMALKFLDSTGSGSYGDAAEAFYYAVNNGADIISNSWGKDDDSQTMRDAIDYTSSQGAIIVAAAGNGAQHYFPHYPAGMENVIAVGSTDSKDRKAGSSNYGDWIDICAPGVDVLSLRADGTSMGTVYTTETTVASGTSMACPHVAGVLALLLSEYPALSCEEILARLLDNADDISAANPAYVGRLGSGRVNAYKSLRFNSESVVEFDRWAFCSNDIIGIRIRDFDVRGTGTQEIILSTDSGDDETVVLTEEPNHPWIFAGSIATTDGLIVPDNNLMEVNDGDIIVASYTDANYGDSGPYVVDETVYVDCVPPGISDVEVHDVTSSGAIVKIKTDESATSRVRYGSVCGGPYNICGEDKTPGVFHDIYMPGLNSQTDYYFVIDANDLSGNQATDTNSGQCYAFRTLAKPEGLHVPSEYPTIQSAIDDANNGNTIWVADGIYTGPGNYDIDFLGKAITVRSENGAKHCTINAQNNGRCFYFRNNETLQSVLDGFTITGGWSGNYSYGGGISCLGGYGPTIKNCIVSGNKADNGGGGIDGGDPSIINCMITNNRADSGGGIYGRSVVVSNCVISGNVATYNCGGGICLRNGYPIIENCLIKNNASLTNNRGGGMGLEGGFPVVKNCLFVDNFAMGDFYGGGAIYANHTNATIENCTFYGNTTSEEGGVCNFRGSEDIYISNCILFGSYPDQIYLKKSSGVVYVSYSDVEGGYSGIGNIDSDPRFADAVKGDFHLKSEAGRWDADSVSWVCDSISSPCIDKGDPSSDWTNELWPHGKRINMGAYGGTNEASWSLSTVGGIADFDHNDVVNWSDWAFLGEKWLESGPLMREDLDRNGDVNIVDVRIFADEWLSGDAVDMNAPTPDPLTWATVPTALNRNAILMRVTTTVDAQGVEYYFECTHGNGHSSGWQDSNTYTDSGLEPESTCAYRTKARDKSAAQNETGWSVEASCTTLDLNSPVACWELDDGGGDMAADSIGGYDGTLYGDPQWVSGQVGTGALEFDGDGDYVRTSYEGGPSEYTISLWYNLNEDIDTSTFSGHRALVSKTGDETATVDAWTVWFANTSGVGLVNEKTQSNYASVYYKEAVFAAGQWHHVVVTGSSSQGKVYFDGDPKSSSNNNFVTGTWDDSVPFDIARPYFGTAGRFFNGKIDDVRIYDRVLGDAEVAQLYQDGLDN